jgi:uncharacterized protein DUF1553/uncharacterized protein DUF1549
MRGLRAAILVCALAALPGRALLAAEQQRSAVPFPRKILKLEVEPASVALAGPRGRQQLLVIALHADGSREDVTDQARYSVVPGGLVRVSSTGTVAPLRDGTGRLRILLPAAPGRAGLEAVAPVSVREAQAKTPVSFVNEVVPALTRAGCNQGICHGAQHGKGSFRLSLLGFDPEADYSAIALEAGGRRAVRSRPEASLLLRKPTLALPHAGGLRLPAGSLELRIVEEWLAYGAPGPLFDERRVTGISVSPSGAVLRPGSRQQLRVIARYSDGSGEDVTARARYSTNNDGVARIDDEGQIRAAGAGETALVVRYQGQVAVARATVPLPGAGKQDWPQDSFVDAEIQAAWRRLGLSPSAPSTDGEFIRRVYLDAIGTLPEPERVRAFLAECAAEREEMRKWGNGEMKSSISSFPHFPISSSPPPRARAKLVDEVLNRPEWVDYWTLYLGDILRNNREVVGEKGMWGLRAWIQDSLRRGKPYNEMVRELIDVRGSTYRNPAANYYSVARTPEDLAETTSQVFLGIRLQCVKCHNHPFEKWTQADYYGFAAFFARVRYKGFPDIGSFGGDQLVLIADSGEVKHPKTGQPMTPKPLDAPPVQEDGAGRLAALAEWLADPQNPFVARSMVNRIWARLMGRGLIDPVDDVRSSNPPTHPELLDRLTTDFAEHGFDLKRLMRRILTSYTYGLSSVQSRRNAGDERFYSHYTVRRLPGEVLLDALCGVTGVPERFPSLPAGTRAISLPDNQVRSYFLETFGRPARVAVCECERDSAPNLTQTLHLLNGPFLQEKIASPEGRLASLLKEGKSDREIIETIYLLAYSRPPEADELEAALKLITEEQAAPENRRKGLEDLLWTLLNSREFLLNH